MMLQPKYNMECHLNFQSDDLQMPYEMALITPALQTQKRKLKNMN